MHAEIFDLEGNGSCLVVISVDHTRCYVQRQAESCDGASAVEKCDDIGGGFDFLNRRCEDERAGLEDEFVIFDIHRIVRQL